MLQCVREKRKGTRCLAGHFPKLVVNVALSVLDFHVNAIKGVEVVETESCLVSLPVNPDGRRRWTYHKYSGVGNIKLDVDNTTPHDVEVLVVDRERLGFDLLLGFDSINKLSGLQIMENCNLRFPKHRMGHCAVIKIEESDFCAEFGPNKKIRVASWKWLEDFRNSMHEYPVPKDVKEEYDHELQTWLD